MFYHGYRPFAEDVDLLVSRQGLKAIHERLEGLGYVPPFAGSKNLRDVESGVKIEFLVEGDFPGDGKPKPVSFPDPQLAATEIDGVRCLQLSKLVGTQAWHPALRRIGSEPRRRSRDDPGAWPTRRFRRTVGSVGSRFVSKALGASSFGAAEE